MFRIPLSVLPFAAAVAVLSLPGCSESKPTPSGDPKVPLERGVAAKEEVVEEEEVSEELVPDSVESAFDSNAWNTAIGLGGGASGKWGGRSDDGARVPLVESSRESYSKVTENAFKSAVLEPISTFGVDVDTASYTNVRRFLRYGRLPPASAVRVEELINYFRYDYPVPKGKDSFSVTLERGTCPWNTDHELVLVGLRGKDVDPDKTPPRNLVFLIDVSGSMGSPDKLPLVQRSLARLVKGLTDRDTVAVVTYAGRESVALEPTSCQEKKTIHDCVWSLGAGGSTNGAGGIQKAYELARQSFHKEHVNRVILVTDGDFNVGVSDTGELTKLIEKERESGVFLTVVGVGTGNLQDGRMSALAKHGNGQYVYLDGDDEARKVFEEGLMGTLVTIAKDVKLQVEFNPRKVAGYRLIGYERRVMKQEEFRDDKKDSGEIGAGHSVTALYEIVPVGCAVPGIESKATNASSRKRGDETMEVRLRYKSPWAERAKESSVKLDSTVKHGKNLEFASAVAVFGLVLSESAHRGKASLALAEELAARGMDRDPGGLRAEFVELVKMVEPTRRAVAAKEARLVAEIERKRNFDERTNAAVVSWRKRRPAIRKGLEWLASRQSADGSWRDDAKGPVHDVGVTGLAVLALLGDGSTMRSGPRRSNVKSGIKWLRDQQRADGLFTSEASKESMLDHVIAACAMSEAFGLSSYKLLRKNAVQGRAYLAGKQSKGSLRTLGWQVLLEESLAKSGQPVNQGELMTAATAILKQPDHQGTWVFSRAPITLFERFLLRGGMLEKNEPVPSEADEILALSPTKLEENDAASFFFGARAIFEIGGRHLTAWQEDKSNAILVAQNNDGTFGGTSRVYDTALMLLALEEPVRHLRAWRRN